MAGLFSVGDVVRLKSGSERMTVESVRGNLVDCVWFGVFREESRGGDGGPFRAGVSGSEPTIEYETEPTRVQFFAATLELVK